MARPATTPEGFRTAAYLAARARLDRKTSGKVKCNPPNRRCGDRCIPPNWKCRVKGEGDDNASRVVASDPLAGAAAIARGRTRLTKGLATGNITEIQAGRAAIARGVVKIVPGNNLKEKKNIRSNVENLLLPVATGLFAVWALRQGHEAAKVLFPVYEKGVGRDIENAASSAIGFVFDRIPFYGSYRQAVRRNANVQAQVIARAEVYGYSRSPEEVTNNNNRISNIARSVTQTKDYKIPGLSTVVNENLSSREEGKPIKGYTQFRSDLLGGVLGAKKDKNSLYAEAATATFLAQQYKVPLDTIRGANNTISKRFLINRVSSRLAEAGESMKRDMEVRGLNRNKIEDVEKYINIAAENAKPRFAGLSPEAQQDISDKFKGTVRELLSPASKIRPHAGLANRLYNETFTNYNKYFEEAARRVRDDTDPRRQIGAASYGTSPVKQTLIGTAELVKSKVKLNSPIAGANHAELVLQRVYHEYSVPGNYNATRKSTWTASDSDVKYAAMDLGWDGVGGVAGAHAFLGRTGQFPRLAPRPREAAQAAQAQAEPKPRTPSRRKPRRRTREELIQVYERAGYTPEAAAKAADKAIAERKDVLDNPRVLAYLLQKEQLKSRANP